MRTGRTLEQEEECGVHGYNAEQNFCCSSLIVSNLGTA
jgi:hypothetical protein